MGIPTRIVLASCPLTLFLSGFLSGCGGIAPKHEYTLSPGQGHHPGLTRALVVPINETADVPAGLDVADERIERLLDAYLVSMGVSVERPDVRDYRLAVRYSVEQSQQQMMSGEFGTTSSEVTFEDIVPRLIEEIGEDVDLVIVPNLSMRTGSATGGKTYKWDGVRRRETGSVSWSMTGDFPVASIFVVVYAKDGTRIFSGYGGLDTIFELKPQKRGMELRDDLLENEEYLTQGICIAFHPYFGEDERC